MWQPNIRNEHCRHRKPWSLRLYLYAIVRGGPYSVYQPFTTSVMRQQTTREGTQWEHQPMMACSNLIPFMDTPLSPPVRGIGLMNTLLNDLLAPCNPGNRVTKKVSVAVQTLPVSESVRTLSAPFHTNAGAFACWTTLSNA